MAPDPPIPDDAGNVTAQWLRQALATCGGEFHALGDVEIERIGICSGLFGKVVRCRLSAGDAADALPKTVIVKLHSPNPKTFRMARRLKLYRREYDYYRLIAPWSPLRSPNLLYSDFEPRSHRFVLVLEDMSRTHEAARNESVSFDQARSAIRAVAHLHSKYWNRVDDPNLSHFPDYLTHQRRLVELAYLVYLPRALHRFGHCFDSSMRRLALAYGPRIVDHLNAMAVGHRTFTHGDFRSANLFFETDVDDGCAAIDWQNCGIHSGLRDVAYFLSTSVTSDVRREIERETLEEYHETLCRMGVEGYRFSECWREYRQVILSCLVGPVLTCGALDLADGESYRTMETGLQRTLAAIEELDADEFLPNRRRLFPVSSVLSTVLRGAYHAYKALS